MSAREEFFAEMEEQLLLAGRPSLTGLARKTGLPVTSVFRVFQGPTIPPVRPLTVLLEAMGANDRTRQHALLLREAALRESRAAVQRATAERITAFEPPAPLPAAGEPDPLLLSTAQEFVAGLTDVRIWAGEPSLRRLEERSVAAHQQGRTGYGRVLRRSTISDMLNSPVLPQLEKVRHFLQICGVRDVDAWVYTWRRIRTVERAAGRRAA
ncbi:hypothetical protein ABZW03_20670 [Kitasatospora sp. NPDC004799]|uniref:hypothetical protein n=1 Tax=Kitasatospora sp. NPDC004799 TaxID=3154460 RepID=UPI0033AD384E